MLIVHSRWNETVVEMESPSPSLDHSFTSFEIFKCRTSIDSSKSKLHRSLIAAVSKTEIEKTLDARHEWRGCQLAISSKAGFHDCLFHIPTINVHWLFLLDCSGTLKGPSLQLSPLSVDGQTWLHSSQRTYIWLYLNLQNTTNEQDDRSRAKCLQYDPRNQCETSFK